MLYYRKQEWYKWTFTLFLFPRPVLPRHTGRQDLSSCQRAAVDAHGPSPTPHCAALVRGYPNITPSGWRDIADARHYDQRRDESHLHGSQIISNNCRAVIIWQPYDNRFISNDLERTRQVHISGRLVNYGVKKTLNLIRIANIPTHTFHNREFLYRKSPM